MATNRNKHIFQSGREVFEEFIPGYRMPELADELPTDDQNHSLSSDTILNEFKDKLSNQKSKSK
jgi:hypothetical protein